MEGNTHLVTDNLYKMRFKKKLQEILAANLIQVFQEKN